MSTTTNRNASAPRTPNVWDERELGVMWKREKKATKEKYLTGALSAKKLKALIAKNPEGDIQFVCFSNKHKSKETHPDLRIYLSEKTGSKPSAPAAAAPAAPAQATTDTSDLI